MGEKYSGQWLVLGKDLKLNQLAQRYSATSRIARPEIGFAIARRFSEIESCDPLGFDRCYGRGNRSAII
ncbi:hypothetical protein GCM10027567_04400 [Spongiibacter taiwanensis]